MKSFKAILAALICISGGATAQHVPGFRDFEIAQGITSSNPVYLREFDGRLYLYASSDGSGREPYYVQGSATPVLIKNMDGSAKHAIGLSYYNPSAWYKGKYYFTAHNGSSGEEMYVYDGTNAPVIVIDPNFGPDSSKPDNYVVHNNILYYTAITSTEGQELWSYNGTTNTMLTDINTGVAGSVFGPMVAFQNQLYFAGKNDTTGIELWRYNPVSTMAEMVADIDTGIGSSNPANLTVIGNKLYFSAEDLDYGRELYEYDGTTAPKRITDIIAGAFSSISGVRTNAFCLFNSKIYFGARDTSTEMHLWSYNPGNGDVKLEHKINPMGESGPREFVVYDNKMFFTADNGIAGYELHSMDAGNAPVLVADLCAGAGNSLPTELTVVGDELFFSATNCNNSGIELFSFNHKRVSVRNLSFAGSTDVYPNPSSANWHIRLTLQQPASLSLTVTDMNGKVVYEQPIEKMQAGTSTIQILGENLPSGSYLYRFGDERHTTVLAGKLVKH